MEITPSPGNGLLVDRIALRIGIGCLILIFEGESKIGRPFIGPVTGFGGEVHRFNITDGEAVGEVIARARKNRRNDGRNFGGHDTGGGNGIQRIRRIGHINLEGVGRSRG
jgi:hypothetical protein